MKSLLKVLEDAQSRSTRHRLSKSRRKQWLMEADKANHELSCSQATHLMAAFEVYYSIILNGFFDSGAQVISRMYAARNELHTFPSIVWCAVAGLRITHKQYFSVYRTSLRLLHSLMYHTQLFNQFLAAPQGTAQSLNPKTLVGFTQGWLPPFEGIQPLVYRVCQIL